MRAGHVSPLLNKVNIHMKVVGGGCGCPTSFTRGWEISCFFRNVECYIGRGGTYANTVLRIGKDSTISVEFAKTSNELIDYSK